MAMVGAGDGAAWVEEPGAAARGRSRISLLELEPELARVLSGEQCLVARRFSLPVVAVEKGGDVSALVERSGSFGVLVFEGMLLEALQLRERATLRLLGPGDVAPIAGEPASLPLGSASLLVPVRARLVLFGDDFLFAARRWPWLVARLHARMVEQSEGLAVQLAISHLPRVEDRLMGVMWLLADCWGVVTPAGIRVPLSLSHEMLGGLIGARRSTVTLALSELAERHSLIKQDGAWLILERPPEPADAEPPALQPLLPDPPTRPWASHEEAEQPVREAQSEGEQIAWLREYERHTNRVIAQSRDLCEQSQDLCTAVRDRRRKRQIRDGV